MTTQPNDQPNAQAPANPWSAYFQAMQQMQQSWLQNWGAAHGLTPSAAAAAMNTPVHVAPATMPALTLEPAAVERIQKQYLQDMAALMQQACSTTETIAPPKDRRFSAEAWAQNPAAAATAAAYALGARALTDLARAVQADDKTRQRIQFAVEQWVAASAPSNFLATNPEAIAKALQTQGQSLALGWQNLLSDIARGHISMTDETQFEVGRNVATTEGAVVFENALFQLIEYKPLTEQVHALPLLIVPPCINKFYILDLQPDNSFIRWTLSQGHRTFVMSWRNPDASCAHFTWDDYIGQALLEAIAQVQTLTAAPQINTLGFCVGGTMLVTALGVLAARGQTGKNGPVASATLLTTLVDFADTGILDIFIDEPFVQMREAQMGAGGLLRGQELASTFSFLRPNDLVWNYVVGNYLKGETPPAFDLLYWNSDATNLPGPYYTWYLRHMYLQNQLKEAGALRVCGAAIDLSQVDVPLYLYGSREDHIVPVASAYRSRGVFKSPTCFVAGASGHIAGVINPPAKNKRSYWTVDETANAAPAPDYESWFAQAQEHKGSWWPHWAAWLAERAGHKTVAPTAYAAPTIEAAPGRYVRQKA